MLVAGALMLSSVALFGSVRDPSNFYYRVSPHDQPLKLEAVYYAPRPEYPQLARKKHLEGAGIAEIHINPDGSVTSVNMLRSTGHKILDEAVIHAFVGWRFRPHSLKVVRVPVQYRMSLSSVRWGSRADLKNVGDGDGAVVVAKHP